MIPPTSSLSTTTTTTTTETTIEEILSPLTSSKPNDPLSLRIAACTSALLSTLPSPPSSTSESVVSLFVAALITLEGTLTTSKKQNNDSDDDDDDDNDSNNANTTPRLPLLKIMACLLPHIPKNDPTYLSHASLCHRILRVLLSLSHDESSTNSTSDDDRQHATAILRTTIKIIPRALSLSPSRPLLNKTLLPLLSSPRGKIRRCAREAISCVSLDDETLRKMTYEGMKDLAAKGSDEERCHLWECLAMDRLLLKVSPSKTEREAFLELLLNDCAASETPTRQLAAYDVLLTLVSDPTDVTSSSLLPSTLSPTEAERILATILLHGKNQTTPPRSSTPPVAIRRNRVLLQSLTRSLVRADDGSSNDEVVGARLLPVAMATTVELLSRQMTAGEDVVSELCGDLTMCLSSLSSSSSAASTLKDARASFQRLLHVSFRPRWNEVLLIVARYTIATRDERLLKMLVNLQDDVVRIDYGAKGSVEMAVKVVVEGVGMEWFLGVVNLGDEGEGKSIYSHLTYLLPLLRTTPTTIHPPTLSLFLNTILPLARRCDGRSALPSLTTFESSLEKQYCMELWQLFPSCCHSPKDLVEVLPMVTPLLSRAILDGRYEGLAGIIGEGCHTLVVSRKESGDEDVETELSKAAATLLPSFFKYVERSPSADDAPHNNKSLPSITKAIATLSTVTPPSSLKPIVSHLLKKILQSAPSPPPTLLTLASTLAPRLSSTQSSQLYRTVKPLLMDGQKKAYAVLAALCQNEDWVRNEGWWEEVGDVLAGSVVNKTNGTRGVRLKCAACVVEKMTIPSDATSDDATAIASEMIAAILGETTLGLKDPNAQTRSLASRLLLQTHERYPRYALPPLLAALASTTVRMQSAGVLALSLLLHGRRLDEETHEDLLSTILLLFNNNDESGCARELLKSIIGFIRVAVVVVETDALEPLLPDVIDALMTRGSGSDNRFRNKVKIILKKLVHRFGYETIVPLVPDGDRRLMIHVRKLAEREKKRRLRRDDDETKSRKTSKTGFDDMMESDEEDSDRGRTLMTGATGLTTRKTTKSGTMRTGGTGVSSVRIRKETLRGEVMDMLDASMAKNVTYHGDDGGDSEFSDDEDDEMMEFDDDGRLIIPDDFALKGETTNESGGDEDEDDDSVDAENEQIKQGAKRRRVAPKSRFDSVKEKKMEVQERNNKRETAARAKRLEEERKTKKQGYGGNYKAKKGTGGDVKKKGQAYEPYAYVPLDARSYSKKKRKESVKKMESVVTGKGKRKRG